MPEIIDHAKTLICFAAPAALCRACWQVALDRGLPNYGFPGIVRGGSALTGSILLGVIIGLMILDVEKLAKWAHLVAGSVGFYAQDVATAAIKAGTIYGRHPGRLFRILKRFLR